MSEKTEHIATEVTQKAGVFVEKKVEKEPYFHKNSMPCVYCGPSVRGVARQFTVYTKGLPEALNAFLLEHPTAKGLLVPVEDFAAVRARLETPGTRESIVFHNLRTKLQGGNV